MTVDHLIRATPPTARPLDPPTSPATPPPATTVPRLRRVCYEPRSDSAGPDGLWEPKPLPVSITADVPDDPAAHAAARHMLLLAVEVLNHRRPITHLSDAATVSVIRCVRSAIPLRGVLRPTSLHVHLPRSGAAEVTAVCRVGQSYRVIAARLDRRARSGWHCTALRLI